LGFYVSGHPLDKFTARLKELNVLSLEQIEGQRNGKEITVAGLIVGTRPMRSKKGAQWAIFTLQDMTGVQELLAFPESFARLANVLKPGTPLLLKVKIQIEEAGTRLSLQEARKLEALAQPAPSAEFRVRLRMQQVTEELMQRLDELFAKSPGPSVVVFELNSPDGSVATLQSQQRIRIDAELVEVVRQICGQGPDQMVA
ncbi:MAG TPA: OB-fold nucleic acid binding domain-containing protein, partial [Candidatus Acidoferrum sp.]